MEPVTAFSLAVGSFLLKHLAKKKLLNPIDKFLEKKYEIELVQLIDKTDKEYQTKYPEITPNDGKHPFYQDQIFLQILLQSSIVIKGTTIESNTILANLKANPNIRRPTKTQIENYLNLFYKNIEEDEQLSDNLKNLWITENYQEEIFKISEQFDVVFQELNTIGEKVKEIHKEVIGSKKTFQKHIDNLAEPIQNSNYARPFYYKSGKVAFVMREEWSEIESFCNNENLVSWWAITGDGGTGKSRLAYEFVRQQESFQNWKMLFLTWENTIFDLEDWAYNQDLLIVLDYITASSENLGKWLEKLYKTIRTYKIRILILQRQGIEYKETGEINYPYWYDNLFKDTNSNTIKNSRYREDFLDLKVLSNQKIKQIAEHYIASFDDKKTISEKDLESILEDLIAIDPKKQRPLFVLFVADAWLKNKENIRSWDRKQLQEWINSNEKKKIKNLVQQNSEANQAALHILSFATVINTISLAAVNTLSDSFKNSVATLKKSNPTPKNAIFKALGATKQGNSTMFQAIEPDIMGEYFVLDFLKEVYDETDPSFVEEFIQTAWNYSPINFAFFLERMLEDFYQDSFVIQHFLVEPKHDKRFAKWLYVSLLVRLSAIQQDEAAVQKTLDLLQALSKKHPAHAEIQVLYAKGLVNLSIDQQDEAAVQKTFDLLQALSEKHPADAEIQVEYAKGLVNLTNKQQDEAAVQKTLDLLQALSEKHPAHAEIQVLYAKGLVNLTNKQQDEVAVQKTLITLKKLADRNKDNLMLVAVYLLGLFLSLEKINTKDRLSKIKKQYNSVLDLAQKQPNHPDMEQVNQILKGVGDLLKEAN